MRPCRHRTSLPITTTKQIRQLLLKFASTVHRNTGYFLSNLQHELYTNYANLYWTTGMMHILHFIFLKRYYFASASNLWLLSSKWISSRLRWDRSGYTCLLAVTLVSATSLGRWIVLQMTLGTSRVYHSLKCHAIDYSHKHRRLLMFHMQAIVNINVVTL